MSTLPEPPRFVPTLTEVVHLSAEDLSPVATDVPTVASVPSAEMQEKMVQRVMQRMEGLLEDRLSGAVAQLVAEHAQALMPRLRDALEVVMRESVTQAFDEEFSAASRPSEGKTSAA